MAKTVKKMTPKEGIQIGRNHKVYRHGDIIPDGLVKSLDKKYLEELPTPKMTPKIGMTLKVDKTKYEPGKVIDQEHLKDIDPQFIEKFTEPEEKDDPAPAKQ